MKRYNYNIINNSLGWLCFVVAAVTYLLTLEPTASFWDCPEFISQGMKLEVGHPPGNPIFMLAARFFINFTGGNVEYAAIAVNTMSALLSAGTILLLFWSVTHLTRKLIAPAGEENPTLPQLIAIMGSGLCGALVYTWSDTFWFSAVEGEVYAFSSFCTALVFWLILKWENRADQPHSDRYLILIAYVIGISIAVHLLNLLCIPAIGLVIYYRKWARPTLVGTLLTLCVAAAVVALILYGLVPGFIGVAGEFEVFCVNRLGMSYNVGVLIYAVILVAVMIWCIRSLYAQRSVAAIRWSFLLTVVLSGMPMIGSGFLLPAVIICGLVIYLFTAKRLPIRILTVIATSILVIFIGYSSYALLLIRSTANPPMNQNAPDNVFDLASYLSREQYGDTPLLYGQSFTSSRLYTPTPDGLSYQSYVTNGTSTYQKNPDGSGNYIDKEGQVKLHYTPESLFPRMHSQVPEHKNWYLKWIDAKMSDLPTSQESILVDADGKPLSYYPKQTVRHPSFAQNLRFFLNYQFNHMYWRYFMWNFAGRQNDLQGQGELNRGNWISGIPFIDNPRLGDQSLLPPDQGKDNPGHNVFYMMPLLLGLIGLGWQAMAGEKGIEQFWVVLMLFFMTGIAIVLYLNQPPLQPRERDYAFAGSFYAFAIWVGMGVAALWRGAMALHRRASKSPDDAEKDRYSLVTACVAAVIGLAVPLQMVSQTWDDHDRSGRYTARDYGMNYLSSLDDNAIIFTNGDNDTFPLWYAQEVEGYRTDVRVVNMSYLTTPWYANQMRIPSYNAPAIEMQATPADYALDSLQIRYFNTDEGYKPEMMYASQVLDYAYRHRADAMLPTYLVAIPSSGEAAIEKGVIGENEAENITPVIGTNIWVNENFPAIYQNGILALDFINTSAENGWDRPVYFAMTVPDDYYLGLDDYLRNTGLAYQVTPARRSVKSDRVTVNTDKMYRNVTERFRWGGLDNLEDGETVYLDETVRRMVSTHRMSLYDLAEALYIEGVEADEEGNTVRARDRFEKALEILNISYEKLPSRLAPYAIQVSESIGKLYCLLAHELDDAQAKERGLEILRDDIVRYAQYLPYYKSLIERQGGIRVGQRYSLTVADLPVSDVDIYVPYYILNLLQTYDDCGGDVDTLDAELNKQGINLVEDIVLVMGQNPFGAASADPDDYDYEEIDS